MPGARRRNIFFARYEASPWGRASSIARGETTAFDEVVRTLVVSALVLAAVLPTRMPPRRRRRPRSSRGLALEPSGTRDRVLCSRVASAGVAARAEVFVFCTDAGGRSWLRPVGGAADDLDTPGSTTFELRCRRLDRLDGRAGGPGVRLRRFRDIDDARNGSGGYDGVVAAIALERDGKARLSIRRFETAAAARAALAAVRGEWLIARIESRGVRPRPAHRDPFTDQVPLRGSRVALGPEGLSGLFVGDPAHLVQWVLMRYPSGRYVVPVLERRVHTGNGEAPPVAHAPLRAPEPRIGDWYAFRRGADGAARLEAIRATEEEALGHAGRAPGRWLLCELVDSVQMV